MAVSTIRRMAEQCAALIEGGELAAGSSIDYSELQVALGQAINVAIKAEYFSVNLKMNEVIPNGSILGLYENIEVVSSNGRSQATLPIKPIKLPRNMGVWAVYPKYTNSSNYDYNKEFIPLQMGQTGLLQSQPLINDLLGQVGYECFGDKLFFTKDIKALFPEVVLAMRLAVMDISQYGDYDPLPITPEIESQVIMQVVQMYAPQPTIDKIVDPTVKEEKTIPVREQKQPE